MLQLTEEDLLAICKQHASGNPEEIMQLLRQLIDEETQVIHQAKPHRIIKRISEHIDEHLGV
jgi:5,10-methenyltetrahydromethanopterin hydrogenase